MNNGMLWWFGSPGATPLERVRAGIAYHQKKYSKPAELCLLHPADFNEVVTALKDAKLINKKDIEAGHVMIDEVLLRPWRGMVKQHALIGIDDDPEYAVAIGERMEKVPV